MRQQLHFLHLGKNAGTQIKFCLAQINAFSPTYEFKFHKHTVMLPDLPQTAKYIFATRDPVQRFRSGFYSRKRKGQPRTYVEWNTHEAWAFENFGNANVLAEVLYDDTPRGNAARKAMQSINHVRQHQHSWFKTVPNFLKNRAPFYILRQECLSDDLKHLWEMLGLQDIPVVATDKVRAHKNDYSGTKELSELAIVNLKRWYQKDFEFIEACDAWRTEKFGFAASGSVESLKN